MWPFVKKKVLDFTGREKSSAKVLSSSQSSYNDTTQNSSSDSGMGFFGAVASSSADYADSKNLKVKIEDIEYKFDNLSRKLSSIMDRLDLVEKKVDRDLRRGV